MLDFKSFLATIKLFLSKKSHKCLFWIESVFKVGIWHIKSQYFSSLLVLLENYMTNCVLPFFRRAHHISLVGKPPPYICTHRFQFHLSHKNFKTNMYFLPKYRYVYISRHVSFISVCLVTKVREKEKKLYLRGVSRTPLLPLILLI